MERIHDQVRFLAGTAAFYQKQMPVGGPLQYETKEQYRERIVAWIDEILCTNNKLLQT
jgi:hypothetical protein